MVDLPSETVSPQDRDLLGRLNLYFDSFDSRLREGQGWLIFNSNRQRSGRLFRFIGDRLREYSPLVSSYLVPWRDFALNAYMVKVELPSGKSEPTEPGGEARQQHEYAIAGRVSQDMYYQMCYCDLFVLGGVDPSYPHELGYLDQVIAHRYENHRSSILITPRMPDELATGVRTLAGDAGSAYWQRFFSRLYDTCLIAM